MQRASSVPLAVFLFISCSFQDSIAQYAPVSWVKVIAGENALGVDAADQVGGLAVDDGGDVIATGSFEFTFNFGEGNLASAGSSDVFLVKYDGDDGSHLWSKRFGATSSDGGRDVVADSARDVFVTGWFRGTVDFGGGGLTSAGASDIFVAKFAGANGDHIWSKRFGGVGNDTGVRVVVDPGGDVYVAGGFDGFYLAHLDGTDGGILWDDRYAGAWPEDINRNSLGSLVTIGYFSGTVGFGGESLSSAGGTDAFVATFDESDGAHEWSARFGSTSNDTGGGIGVDGYDHIIITGGFIGTVSFGGTAIVSSGDPGDQNSDIFLVKLTPGGAHVWSKAFGQPATSVLSERGQRVAVSDDDAIVMAGHFSEIVDFGGGPLEASLSDEADLVVAAFSPSGDHLWSMNVGGDAFIAGCAHHSDGWQDPSDMIFDAAGALLIGGVLDGPPTDFGAGFVNYSFDCAGLGEDSGFLAKYFPPAAALSDANLLVCPQGHLESISATMDFADGLAIGTVAADSITLGGPMGTVNLFGMDSPVASGNATPVNGYTATVTSGAIGGCSGGATVPFHVRVQGPVGRLSITTRATVMSPDFDGDGVVGASDLDILKATYSKCPGQSGYNACANFIETGTPGCVSLADYAFFCTHYGHAASGDPLLILPAPDQSIETSVAIGSIVDDPGRFVVTLERARGLRWADFEISLGSGWDLEDWTTNHSTFSGDVLALMRDGALRLHIITPGGETVSGNGIELGELVLRSTASMAAHDSGFELHSGTVRTDNALYSAIAGPLPLPARRNPVPVAFRNELIGNVPNPFNPATTIRFSAAEGTKGELNIYSATGALVRTLVDGPISAGSHSVEWNGRDNRGNAVVSGVYFCQLKLGSFVDRRKLVLLK